MEIDVAVCVVGMSLMQRDALVMQNMRSSGESL